MDTQNGDLFDQIKTLAPTVHALVNSRQARIAAAVTSHDVVNGYGRGFTFHLKIEILSEFRPLRRDSLPAPPGHRSFLLCPPLRVSSKGLPAKRFPVSFVF